MQLTTLTENEFISIKDNWNQLLQESSNNEFFLTWEWIYTWWEIYGKDKKLFILSVQDDSGKIVGIAPWYIRKNRIYFIGTGENIAPEYLNIIVKTGSENIVIERIFQYLKNQKNGWSIIYLRDTMQAHLLNELILTESKNKNMPAHKVYTGTPCVYLPLPEENKELWKQLSSKFRYNIKWGRKKIKGMPENRISFFFNERIPPEIMGRLFDLHNKRMKEKGGNGKFQLSNYRQFHLKLLERIPNYTAIAMLEADKKPIAMIYGYHYHNKIYFYQSGFDPESNLKKYSPVQLLLSYMIEKAIEMGCSEFDFLRGEEEYKQRWSNLLRKKEGLVIFNTSSLQGRILHLGYRAKKIIKDLLKK